MLAATKWLKVHHTDYRVLLALKSIESLLEGAGAHVNAYSLQGLSPEKRARAALARLREKGVAPNVILARAIAVAAWYETSGFRSHEFLEVQTAKVIHRLASGTDISNKVWKFPRKFPRSEGRILRYLGKRVADRAALAIDDRPIMDT